MSCMINLQSSPTGAGKGYPSRQSNAAATPCFPITINCSPTPTGNTSSRPGAGYLRKACDSSSGVKCECLTAKCPPYPVNVKCFPTSCGTTPSPSGSGCPRKSDPGCGNSQSEDKCSRSSSRTTPPIRNSKRLTKPRPRDTSSEKDKLCCRPKWLKTDSVIKVQYIINYRFPPLPSVSSRYQKWVSKAEPQVDTNLSASKFSSKRENMEKIAAMPVPKGSKNCPCHSCR